MQRPGMGGDDWCRYHDLSLMLHKIMCLVWIDGNVLDIIKEYGDSVLVIHWNQY